MRVGVRKQQKLTAWLGLLALALQLVLSFGHHHSHEGGRHAAGISAATAASCTEKSSSACQLAPDDGDEEHCSLCWATARATALVLQSPLDVAPAAPIRAPPFPFVIAIAPKAGVAQAFLARGPPETG